MRTIFVYWDEDQDMYVELSRRQARAKPPLNFYEAQAARDNQCRQLGFDPQGGIPTCSAAQCQHWLWAEKRPRRIAVYTRGLGDQPNFPSDGVEPSPSPRPEDVPATWEWFVDASQVHDRVAGWREPNSEIARLGRCGLVNMLSDYDPIPF